VVSALGATIAVITLTLLVLTSYLSYKVYYLNDVQLEKPSVQSAHHSASEMESTENNIISDNIKTTAQEQQPRKKAQTTVKKELEGELYRETFNE